MIVNIESEVGARMEESEEKFSHIVFANDPIEFRAYVHKYVEVKTVEDDVHEGTLYTIDPVSESIILINKCEEQLNMDIIMGHAVKFIQVKKNSDQALEDVFVPQCEEMTAEELERRKETLRCWLLKNRTPVEEDGQILRIGKVVEIHPPYGLGNCLTSNEIILGRLQNLILSMPDNITNT